ncbi:protein of unknown function [Mucilaginibacter pineti]|uniref:DUF4133 domain-containing protein n=1 Tax=Mucilaginibacter pineti TaxID=1391627 RepID=A0A1G7ISF3_9SPHI|nr:DUF4133 domain-containing protein [Mucilaginibacter pineti]SDF15662.1 protein of unknown function [Mucilaginibacter pineti]
MNNSIYHINKGINKSIEFKGLRAQYIWYFGGLVVLLLVLFAALYISGVNTWICLALTGGIAATGSARIFSLSHQYGEHGLMKALARRRIPRVIKSYSRRKFQQLSLKEEKK